jgi:hypothetical protein
MPSELLVVRKSNHHPERSRGFVSTAGGFGESGLPSRPPLFACVASRPSNSTDRDAEVLKKVLGGVSIRHEEVRGEGSGSRPGCP